MTRWYSIDGWVRVRRCIEVEQIVAELRTLCCLGIEVDTAELEANELQVCVEGCSDVPATLTAEIEELLGSLGLYASEGAVFSGDCDGQPWEVVVAPSEEAGRLALSQSRLEEIDPLVDDLTVEDRARLVAKIQAPGTRSQPRAFAEEHRLRVAE
jgi:hypothetical protein